MPALVYVDDIVGINAGYLGQEGRIVVVREREGNTGIDWIANADRTDIVVKLRPETARCCGRAGQQAQSGKPGGVRSHSHDRAVELTDITVVAAGCKGRRVDEQLVEVCVERIAGGRAEEIIRRVVGKQGNAALSNAASDVGRDIRGRRGG